MTSAIVRRPSPAMADGQRTHLGRAPIDGDLAQAQHAAYVAALEAAGAQVTVLPADPGLPDCAFVEDCAVILPELALVCRMGAAVRRPESPAVAAVLPADRPRLGLAGEMDGGDVLILGRRIFVGRSSRTGREGIEAFEAAVALHGYRVIPVPVAGALHLKTAVTALDAETLLINPAWVEAEAFAGLRTLAIDNAEPFAANTLTLGGRLIVQAETPRTGEMLARAGYAPYPVAISEFAKAEAGLTCLSLIVPPSGL
jgi:dimethylargininase